MGEVGLFFSDIRIGEVLFLTAGVEEGCLLLFALDGGNLLVVTALADFIGVDALCALNGVPCSARSLELAGLLIVFRGGMRRDLVPVAFFVFSGGGGASPGTPV